MVKFKAKINTLAFLIFFFTHHPLWALQFQDLSAYLGNMHLTPGRVQKDRQGNTEKIDLRPYIGTAFQFGLDETWSLNSNIAFTFPSNGREDNLTHWIFKLRQDITYWTSDALGFYFGLGLLMGVISGDGGVVTRDNGTSSSSYYEPKISQATFNYTYNLGVHYWPWEILSLRGHLHILDLFEKNSRTLGYSLSINYHFGDMGYE